MLTKVSTRFEIQTIMFIVCNRDEDKKDEEIQKPPTKKKYETKPKTGEIRFKEEEKGKRPMAIF